MVTEFVNKREKFEKICRGYGMEGQRKKRKPSRDTAENFEPDIFSHLSWALEKTGFSAQRHMIEVNGICASCGPTQAIP